MKRAARGEAMAEAKESSDAAVVGTSMGWSGLGAAVGASALAAVVSPAAAGVVSAAAGGSSSASPLGSWPSQTSPIGQPLQA